MTEHRQCRICMKDGTMKNIFLKQDKIMISTKIMYLAKIHIYPGDGLPNTICSNCITKLNSCYDFIHMCEVSDSKLRANYNKINNIEEPSSPIPKYELQIDNIFNNDPQDNEDLKIVQNKNTCEELYMKRVKRMRSSSKAPLENKSRKVNNEKKIAKQQCSTCGKVMSSKFRLKTHLRTHTGERPFSCPHCNKNFSLAQNLKVHLRTHTGEKPFQCSVCKETFAQSAGLAAHKRNHTGQTPYRCMLCPRSFRTIGHLQYHIRRHTGEKKFECEICGRAFITRSDLKQHIMTHSGEKPHVCSVCGLRLTRASHLKRHVQHMHSGIQTIICSECSIPFKNQIEYQEHRKHHCVTKIQHVIESSNSTL